jgi:hypothetical protein
MGLTLWLYAEQFAVNGAQLYALCSEVLHA